MMHATTLLRQSLPLPPRSDGTRSNVGSRSTPIWYTKIRRRVVFLNPGDAMVRAQVHYKRGRGGATNAAPSDRGHPLTLVHLTFCSSLTLTTRSVRSSVSFFL